MRWILVAMLGVCAAACERPSAPPPKKGGQSVQGLPLSFDWPEKLTQVDVIGSTLLVGEGVKLLVRSPLPDLDPLTLESAEKKWKGVPGVELLQKRKVADGYAVVARAKTPDVEGWELQMVRQIGGQNVYCECTSAVYADLEKSEKLCLSFRSP